jgi:1-acyl-sn-glycerol-3-phosphate acyltransferase
MADYRTRRARLRRRAISVPLLATASMVLTLGAPIWLPVVCLVDAVRLRRRFPLARLLVFGTCWTWIELAGVARAFGLWARGRAGNSADQYELMRWWADALMTALQRTLGIVPQFENAAALAGGNAIVLARHASLADSLLSAWAIRGRADLWPRYVLKRELLFDPCLDIVGLRVPNHFLDREANDGDRELDAVRALSAGVGPGTVAVIFAEGTRANPTKRSRALEKIAARDPKRAERLNRLQRLLPPRPGGAAALVEGAPRADVVLAWHTGFDGLDSFGGMVERLAKPLPPVRFVVRRVPRGDVPTGDAFVEWLDEQWLRMDAEVDAALAVHGDST